MGESQSWGAVVLDQTDAALTAQTNASLVGIFSALNSHQGERRAIMTFSDLEEELYKHEGMKESYDMRAVVYSREQPDPSFLLGPGWLSPSLRALIATLETSAVKLWALLFLIIGAHNFYQADLKEEDSKDEGNA